MSSKLRVIVCFYLSLFAIACGGAQSGTSPVEGNSSPTPGTDRSGRAVTIDSPDGVQIVGSYFESPKPNSPAVLLLHQWQSDRHSYDDFAKKMQAKGFNVLAIDGRGFGESTKTTDGKTVEAERTPEAVKAMLGDVDAAMKFLADQPNVDKTKIGIAGASYGSSLALIYAADHPNVAAVAMISPGLNYFGNMPTEPAVIKYGVHRPLLLVSARDDPDSDEAVDVLMQHATQEAKWGMTRYPPGGHGTALFSLKLAPGQEKFELANLLETFFTERMGVTAN